MGKGKSDVGKIDAILTDSHVDTRIKICILMNMVVPLLQCTGEVWEGNSKRMKQPETAAKTALGCSSTTGNTLLRAQLGMYPADINRGGIS